MLSSAPLFSVVVTLSMVAMPTLALAFGGGPPGFGGGGGGSGGPSGAPLPALGASLIGQGIALAGGYVFYRRRVKKRQQSGSK
jgi:hypothetical protein